ncbi:ABC transporter ATP-binding protein [Oryzihumus sp.]|uniref:ABC transporter ATP-binding protein n=1 Tax=Oryzihumus sp. TaxID=1968903 RepID=UPI002ED94655
MNLDSRETSGVLTVDGVVERGEFRLAVSATVAPGEVLGVLGPNGAGKSTLLRALAGLTGLASGTVRLGGTVLDGEGVFVPPEQRPVGLVFQSYRLFPHLSVLDNVAFAPRSRGLGRRRSREIARGWLERLDLAELADRRPAQVSGGQAQRVALARALAAEPGLLLLDEPLSALDAGTRLDVRTLLRRHLEFFAGPVLVVTHDPLEAMVLCDRLLVIEGGRVVQQGTPAAVARHPATEYVARLVGLNLYAGRLDPGRGSVALDGGGVLAVTPTAEARGSDRVLVGLRPSAITVHTVRPEHASVRNVWAGTIESLELLTDRVRVSVAGTPSALVDVTPGAVAELGLAPGQAVWLSAKATETDAYPESATARHTAGVS